MNMQVDRHPLRTIHRHEHPQRRDTRDVPEFGLKVALWHHYLSANYCEDHYDQPVVYIRFRNSGSNEWETLVDKYWGVAAVVVVEVAVVEVAVVYCVAVVAK